MNKRIGIFSAAMTAAFAIVAGTSATATNAQTAQMPASQAKVASFTVAKMTCATCPITVKKAMSAVHGVRSVRVDFASKTATVEYDPRATNSAAIATASTNAGYPATPTG